MEIFTFSPSKNLIEKGKWLLAVTSFEATNSAFNITNGNKSFSITTPSHWSSRRGAETIDKLQKVLKPRSENDIGLHVKEVEKRGNKIKKTRNVNYLILILINTR